MCNQVMSEQLMRIIDYPDDMRKSPYALDRKMLSLIIALYVLFDTVLVPILGLQVKDKK